MAEQFKYTTAIRKIRKMKARIKVIPGGSSAGKTWSILPILIDKAIKNDSLSISVVSESMPHLKRGAMRDFIKIMKLTNRFIPSSWNITNSIYTFANGSYIEFFSADDESKLRGARRNVLYINEANNIKFDAYNQLAMRTDMDIYIDYNPTHRFWCDTDVVPDDDAEVLILTYKDNEALSNTVVDYLESKIKLVATSDYWKNWVDVYVYGKVGKLEGVIFNNWSEIGGVPDDARLVGYGMDFGFTNDATTLIAVYKYNEDIILDEIIYRKGLQNSDIANLMKSNGVTDEVFADSAEPKSIAELRRYGLNVRPTKKGKDSIVFGIGILQEFNMLVTKRSSNIKDELNKYHWMKDKEGNPTNTAVDAFNHCIDAIRYLAMMKLYKRNETARMFNIG